MGCSHSVMDQVLSGYSPEDLQEATRRLHVWELTQKGISLQEAESLVEQEEAMAKESKEVLATSLLARLGGHSGVKWVFSDFYARILSDARICHFFDGIDMSASTGMPSRQSAFMCHMMMGPNQKEKPYRGQDLRTYMRKVHIPVIEDGFVPEHYDMAIEHLGKSLIAAKVSPVLITEAAEMVASLKPYIFEPMEGEENLKLKRRGKAYKAQQEGQAAAVAVAEGTETMAPSSSDSQPSSGSKKAGRCPFHFK